MTTSVRREMSYHTIYTCIQASPCDLCLGVHVQHVIAGRASCGTALDMLNMSMGVLGCESFHAISVTRNIFKLNGTNVQFVRENNSK